MSRGTRRIGNQDQYLIDADLLAADEVDRIF
jgi:hypothetical protein